MATGGAVKSSKRAKHTGGSANTPRRDKARPSPKKPKKIADMVSNRIHVRGKYRTLKRGGKVTPEVKKQFLEFLRKVPNVAGASAHIGCSRENMYAWKQRDPVFSKDWDDAIAQCISGFEQEAIRRGQTGYERSVWYQGEVVGEETHYSDRLMERILEAHHKSYSRKHEITGPEGGPITVQVRDVLLEKIMGLKRQMERDK